MLFSIIIPLYNSEKSLKKCLKTIQDQAFEDFEVILVDDGSTDRSYSICQEYTKQDVRFKTIRQENQGPSAARNEGLRKAAGDYICFIDSDDYISSDYLEELSSLLKGSKADAVFFGYNKVDQNDNVLETHLPPVGLQGDGLLAELSYRDMFGYTWVKCFAREVIGENAFPEDMSLFEDEVFSCHVLKKANTVVVLPKALYYYVIDGDNMLTGRTRDNYCELSDRVYAAWKALLINKADCEKILQRKANSFTARCRYYGFEHDVNVKGFFKALGETRFFQEHKEWSSLDYQIQKRNWKYVDIARTIYRTKQRLRALI